jgi:hypothetical protein
MYIQSPFQIPFVDFSKPLPMTAADFITLRTVSPAWQTMILYDTQGRIAVEILASADVPSPLANFLVDFLQVFAESNPSSGLPYLNSNIEVFCEQSTYQAAGRMFTCPGHRSFCTIETSHSGIHGYHAG